MSFNLLHTMCSFQGTNLTNNVLLVISCKNLFLHQIANKSFFIIRRPPTLPYRHQYSTIGRLCLNHRVRDGNGCVPQAHRHRKSLSHLNDWTVKQPLLISLERRWSSRTFRYGYLVTTSPQLSDLPSAAPSYVRSPTSGISDSHGVTGGVYKTRERIHRSILICDY